MAKGSFKGLKGNAKGVSKPSNPSNAATLSARQKYVLRKMAERTKRMEIKSKPNTIRNIGKAVAEGSAPAVSTYASNKAADAYTAVKRSNADAALAEWNRAIKSEGEDSTPGVRQGKSTTETTSAGTFSSVID